MSVLALLPLIGPDETDDRRVAAWLGTHVGGASLLARSVHGLVESGVVDRVLMVTPGSELDSGVSSVADSIPVAVAAGSLAAVCAAELASERSNVQVVLIHDPLRAFTPPELITRVVTAVLASERPVVPVLECSDTVQRLDGDGRVEQTLDRAGLRVAQTPVGYPAAMIRSGAVDFAAVNNTAVDVGWPLAGAGTVPGDPAARRLAGPIDLTMMGLSRE